MERKKDEMTRAVAEAESAVASVKDPELKRAAFEKVLEHLLKSESVPSKKAKSQDARGRSKNKQKAGHRVTWKDSLMTVSSRSPGP